VNPLTAATSPAFPEPSIAPAAPLVCLHSEVTASLMPGLGGKGRGLARLAALGHPVPPWYAVTTTAFTAALAGDGLAARITARLGDLEEAAAAALRAAAGEIRGWLLAADLPPGLATAVAEAHAACLLPGSPVAVRSSAADEDGTFSSFAGVHDSLLGVRGVDGALAALKEVWASVYSERALAYRRARGLPLAPVTMAVVIQHLVPARVSGVLFTVNPASGSVREVVISALYGLGEGLVGMGMAADRYVFAKPALARSIKSGESIVPSMELATKTEQMLPQPLRPGLAPQPVAAELQDRPCLTPEQALHVAQIGLSIERQLKRPQDLEFAFDESGRFLLLQARPITDLGEYGPAAGQRIVWDHENWAENYPGITLPLTYSVLRRQERVGYHSLAEMMRMDPRRVFEYQLTYDHPLGYICGRIVTNEISRYRLMCLIRGIDFNRRGLLGLLGFRIDEVDPEPDPEPAPLRRYLVELPALISLFAGLGRDFLHVHRDVEALLQKARHFHERCAAMDFRALEPYELLAVYTEVETQLVAKWKAPLLNALFLRMLYVVLRRLCRVWCGDTTGSLHNALLRGDQGSESARPVKLLLRLASTVHRDPALRELFALHSPALLAERIPSDPAHAGFAREVERYLTVYHYQSVYEMKLESDTLRDRPELLYLKIRNYVAQGDAASLDPEAREEQEQQVRQEAQQRAEAGLRRHRSWLPRRRIFRWVLREVRTLDSQREDVKFMRLRLMGLFRELLRALGQRLVDEDALAAPGDIFYLTLEEIVDYVRGSAVTTKLGRLAELRRREIDAFAAAAPPADRFETYGTVYDHNLYRSHTDSPAVSATGELRGTGSCRGRVTGTVRVLRSPTEVEALDGEILVVERIHTGWFALLPFVSGLLIERGEILSHATTVAREMGIPTVVGIPGLTATLRDGQRVLVDGEQGVVTLLGGPPET
jgi:phosphohistidine swiveling domain-containing protein